jgi:hypothetical protein
MVSLLIEGEIAQRLQDLAQREARPVEDVLESLIEGYIGNDENESSADGFLAMDGMFDDDITDLSSITKEDVMEAYRKKYANSD